MVLLLLLEHASWMKKLGRCDTAQDDARRAACWRSCWKLSACLPASSQPARSNITHLRPRRRPWTAYRVRRVRSHMLLLRNPLISAVVRLKHRRVAVSPRKLHERPPCDWAICVCRHLTAPRTRRCLSPQRELNTVHEDRVPEPRLPFCHSGSLRPRPLVDCAALLALVASRRSGTNMLQSPSSSFKQR